MKIRFMTGEMAQLHGISKQTLIHYDRIGLLSPSEVDPDTEYRYYDINQFEDLELILILKNLGMQLKEIKSYRDQAPAESRLVLLENQREAVREKLEQFKRIDKRLKGMVDNLRQSLEIEPFSRGIKWVEECSLISEYIAPPYDIYQLELCFKKKLWFTKEAEDLGFHSFLVFVEEGPEGEDLFKKVSVPGVADGKDVFPAGYYGYVYHKGPFETIAQTRDILKAYVRDSGYVATGLFIERVLLSNLEVGDEKEYLIEIQVEVAKESF